jgi:hypothetical protein
MLHWYSKVTIILTKRKNGKKTIIMRRREYHPFADSTLSQNKDDAIDDLHTPEFLNTIVASGIPNQSLD